MRHLLDISDLSSDDVWQILHTAETLKAEWRQGGNAPILRGKALGMVFQKPSLRTRVSFEMAMQHLGGHALYLSPNEISLGARESVPDVARVLSRYVDAIMARTFDHQHILQLAQYSRVPVINGLSDFSHPCQALSDLFTIYEKYGRLAGLKLAYVGDGNNVAVSLAQASAKVGMSIAIASPPGFSVAPQVGAAAAAEASKQGADVVLTTDPQAAVSGADVIYTDTWTSMGQEAEAVRRRQVFPPFQVNEALVEASGNDDVIVMHCLPAHRGEEITDAVADGPHSALWDQAENRMHCQKAILALLMT
ncbi:ornithine carbamoyltransferase [Candidatus Amarolinea aalborgensis]|uniref:ornithine carbamoyltransferase n=1 Tax=Candidatus Amarolinea aalborgensis TaxID=2249329 RepID=UPI003BF9ABF2